MTPALQKPFAHYTRKSFFIHSGLILFAVIASYFQWSQGEKQRKLNVKLVQSSVRVDVVAMPKRTLQELKALQSAGQSAGAPAPAEEAKVEPDNRPDTGNEFIKEKKKVSFQDLMKQYSKDKVEKSKSKKTKGKDQSKGQKLDSNTLAKLDGLIKRGNKVSSGQALVGSGSAESLTALQEYAATLPNLVKPYWKLPSYLVEKNLQCRIRVYINGRGELIRSEVYEKSDDPEYDERAMKAIKAAAPFPPPAGDILKRTLRGDILLGFPL